MGSLSAASPVTSFSSLSTAPENLSPSLLMVAITVLRLSISCWTVCPLSASAVGERRRLGEQRFDVAVLALKDLDQRVGQRVDVLRIKALDNRFESAEEQVEVQRRLGAVQRNLAARRLDLRRPRAVDQFQIPVADQVEVAHRRLGSRGQHDLAVGVEVDDDLVVGLQRNVLDRADANTGHPHRISGLQARRVGEERPSRSCPNPTDTGRRSRTARRSARSSRRRTRRP